MENLLFSDCWMQLLDSMCSYLSALLIEDRNDLLFFLEMVCKSDSDCNNDEFCKDTKCEKSNEDNEEGTMIPSYSVNSMKTLTILFYLKYFVCLLTDDHCTSSPCGKFGSLQYNILDCKCGINTYLIWGFCLFQELILNVIQATIVKVKNDPFVHV